MGILQHIGNLGESTLLKTDFDGSGNNNATYTFSAMSLGDAAGDRYMVAAVSMSSNGSDDVLSVTIAGIAATEVVDARVSSGGVVHYSGLWIALVPSGTSGDVVVNNSGTCRDCAATLYRLTGIASATPTDTDEKAEAAASSHVMSLDVTVGGIVLATANNEDQTTGHTWVGVDEDEDLIVDNIRYSAASRRMSAAQVGHTVSVTTGNTRTTVVCAHWAQG